MVQSSEEGLGNEAANGLARGIGASLLSDKCVRASL